MYSTQLSLTSPQSPVNGFAGRADLYSRLLQLEDLAALHALRDEVLGALPNPDCYVREADEAVFYRQHLSPQGATIGVFHHHQLVAYAMLGLPSAEMPHPLADALGLSGQERAELSSLSSCMVRPDWRGLGLQRALLGARLALADGFGRRLCVGMVSLHNHSSRHNMLRLGMYIAWAGQLDGLQRQITLIDLRRHPHVAADDERLIDSNDLDAQRQALTDGYIGIGEWRLPRQVRLRFQRRLPGQLLA